MTKFFTQERQPGTPSIVNYSQFCHQFQIFTSGLFENFDFSNVVIVGGSILASLLPLPTTDNNIEEYYKTESPFKDGDINLCIYGNLSEDQFIQKLEYIHNYLATFTQHPISILRANSIFLCPCYPFRHVQITIK